MASLISRFRRSGLSEQKGNALIEFALVLPLLLLVFAGIVDFGFAFQRYEVLTNAVREGARLAVLPDSTSDAPIRTRVSDYVLAGLGNTDGLGAVTVLRDPASQRVTVSTTLESQYVILGPIAGLIRGGGSFTSIELSATSVMRMEVAP